MNTVAVIIPAYKPDYLGRTLESLAEQSFKGFTVYIGDDASPYDLSGIVSQFSSSLDIHYTRFQENYGGRSLVRQWERCVRLCQKEDFVILFSDDDMMESKCIESFVNCTVPDNVNVLHFDINIIDGHDHLVQNCPPFPEMLDSESFFDLLFRRRIVARMPEFILRRTWLLENGIVPFGLAWRSDTATVLKAGRVGGIKTISGEQCRVLWRASAANISGNPDWARQKNVSNVDFFNWLHDQKMELPMSRFHLLKTIVFALEYQSTGQYFRDAVKALGQLKYAAGRRTLTLLFVLYRIPYHWMELRRS